jgi:Na+-transporting methylmalonyl-CoA/oxaloacetate decarboxylase gamma subunit
MEDAIFSGPTMAVVGITTVFIALAIIVGAVSAVARIVASNDGVTVTAEAASAFAAAADASASNESGDEDVLRRVATAAYAYHLRRCVTVRASVASTPWLRAGRQAQVDRIQSRG